MLCAAGVFFQSHVYNPHNDGGKYVISGKSFNFVHTFTYLTIYSIYLYLEKIPFISEYRGCCNYYIMPITHFIAPYVCDKQVYRASGNVREDIDFVRVR